nr:hypothetical protein [Mycolicibacterium mengxianglii]
MSGAISKSASLAWVCVAYFLAFCVGAGYLVLGPASGRLWLDTLVADVLATLVVFAFSRSFGNSSFMTLIGVLSQPLLMFYWWARGGAGFGRLNCVLLAVVVMLWAVRLTANWLMLGALAMLAMFLGASIPMMETRSLQRRPDYQHVIDRVSRFVPRPPAKARG